MSSAAAGTTVRFVPRSKLSKAASAFHSFHTKGLQGGLAGVVSLCGNHVVAAAEQAEPAAHRRTVGEAHKVDGKSIQVLELPNSKGGVRKGGGWQCVASHSKGVGAHQLRKLCGRRFVERVAI